MSIDQHRGGYVPNPYPASFPGTGGRPGVRSTGAAHFGDSGYGPFASPAPAGPYRHPAAPQYQPELDPYGLHPECPVERTNTFALLALVFAFFVPPAGVVLGIIAKKQISEYGDPGEGKALAGIIVGGVLTALVLIGYVIYIVSIIAALSTVS